MYLKYLLTESNLNCSNNVNKNVTNFKANEHTDFNSYLIYEQQLH